MRNFSARCDFHLDSIIYMSLCVLSSDYHFAQASLLRTHLICDYCARIMYRYFHGQMRMRMWIRMQIKLNSVSSITCNVSNNNNSNNPLSAKKMCRSFLVKKDQAKKKKIACVHTNEHWAQLRLKFMKTEKKIQKPKKRNICPQSCWWLLMWYYNECNRQKIKTI